MLYNVYYYCFCYFYSIHCSLYVLFSIFYDCIFMSPQKYIFHIIISFSANKTKWCHILIYFTSKPSARRHILCASIIFWHSGSSSPLKTIHSSLGFFVSGQQQQIGFPDLIPTFLTFGLSWTRKRMEEKIQRQREIEEISEQGQIVHQSQFE